MDRGRRGDRPAGGNRDRLALRTLGASPGSLQWRHRVLPGATRHRVLSAGERGDRPTAVGSGGDRGRATLSIALDAMTVVGGTSVELTLDRSNRHSRARGSDSVNIAA